MARKSYTQEFKANAVRLLTHEGHSLAKAAKHLGVTATTLSAWRRQLVKQDRIDFETENQRLRRQVRDLEMEREILKKVSHGVCAPTLGR